MKKTSEDWFANWFDSPYYHLLYQHRDNAEAAYFIKNLIRFLDIPKNGHVIDLACGKGRHSFFLQKFGFRVTGLDLSPNNIQQATAKYGSNSVDFKVADMRMPFPVKANAVFNLFTSFGYFENEAENVQVLKNIKDSLLPKGLGVIDYLNATLVQKSLCPYEKKEMQGITFTIKRTLTREGFIEKNIHFQDKGIVYHYKEKVKNLCIKDFEKYFEKVGLKIENVFGDYALAPFDENSSPRCILIFSV